jgi:hypothetical protein
MQAGWDRYRSGLNLAMRTDQLFNRAETPATEFAGDCVSPGNVGIDDAHQSHGFILFGELMIDASVIAPEGSHTDNCDVNCVFVFQSAKSFYLFVMLSEVELPLAEAQRVEASLLPFRTPRDSPGLREGIGVPSATLGTGSPTWFFFASEEEQALRMTNSIFNFQTSPRL